MKPIDIPTVTVQRLPIRLGQFLKLADLVGDGLEAKYRILEGEVLVNGEVETRRGRQLQPGDEIQLGTEVRRLAAG